MQEIAIVSAAARRIAAAFLFSVVAAIVPLSAAASSEPPSLAEALAFKPASLRPDRIVVRSGLGRRVRTTTVGLQWDLPWRQPWGSHGVLSAHSEIALGHWKADAEPIGGSAVSTQVGLTPVFRYTFRGDAGWFVEGGIGANLIAPVYRSSEKQFSTAFNFGDHLGIGWRSPGARAWEWALRFQHFSNAGIARPNPGEDFVQFQISLDID
jgi:hypothetical protein